MFNSQPLEQQACSPDFWKEMGVEADGSEPRIPVLLPIYQLRGLE